MSRRWIGVVAVVVVAVGIVLLKRPPPTASADDRATAPSAQPTVLLFADPGEAGSRCGCGEIIRIVRAAASRGVRVRELDPRGARVEVGRHRVRVQPTVLILDRAGRETQRFEGESRTTIDGIGAALRRLTPRRS